MRQLKVLSADGVRTRYFEKNLSLILSSIYRVPKIMTMKSNLSKGYQAFLVCWITVFSIILLFIVAYGG